MEPETINFEFTSPPVDFKAGFDYMDFEEDGLFDGANLGSINTQKRGDFDASTGSEKLFQPLFQPEQEGLRNRRKNLSSKEIEFILSGILSKPEPTERPLNRAVQLMRGITARPAMGAFMQWFGRDETARIAKAPYARRRKEFRLERLSDVSSDDKDRYISHLFSALAHNPEARSLYEIMVDRAAEQDRERVLDGLRKGEANYAPVLIVGAGYHGSVVAAEIARLRPDIRPVIVDQNPRIGGHFRTTHGPAYFKNNRTRPMGEKYQQRPGDVGSIFPHGRATVQESDLTDAMHATNADTGMMLGSNEILNAITLPDIEFVVSKPKRRASQPGATRAIIRDMRTGEEFSIFADVIIQSQGLGKETYGLTEFDDLDQAIIDNENINKQQDPNYRPRIMTSTEFHEWVSDPRRTFPLEGVKKVIVVGGGDAASGVIKRLAGVAPDQNGTMELDWVEEIIQVATNVPNDRSERRKKNRNFYGIETNESDRGKPYNGRLRVFNGKVSNLTDSLTTGKIGIRYRNTADFNSLEFEDGDLVVFATGTKPAELPVKQKKIFSATATEPVALQEDGTRTYYIGPHTRLPIESSILERIAGLDLPENNVAGFGYEPKSTQFARIVVQDFLPPKTNGRNPRMIRLERPATHDIPNLDLGIGELEIIDVQAPKQALPIQPDLDRESIAILGLAEAFYAYKFSDKMAGTEIVIAFERTNNGVVAQLPREMCGQKTGGLVESIITNPLLQQAIYDMTASGFKRVKINLPIAQNGCIDTGAIRVQKLRLKMPNR